MGRARRAHRQTCVPNLGQTWAKPGPTACNDQFRRSDPHVPATRSRSQRKDTGDRCSREFHDTDSPPFPWRNFRVTVVDRVIELIESLGIVAVLAPITRLRQEAVLALCCSDDDPHWRFLSLTVLFRAAITVLLINRNSCRQLNRTCRHAERT